MDLALIIDDTINQYKHKTPMPLKSKFKKIFDDAWGKAHLMQMEDLPAEEKYAFSLFYKKANDTMTDEEKEKDKEAENCKYIRYVCLSNAADVDWINSSRFTIEKLGRRNEILSGEGYENYTTNESAMNCAEYKHWTLSRLTDNVTVECVLIPWLDVNQKISYTPKYINTGNQPVDFLIKKIDISLGDGTMTVTMSRYWPYYPYIVKNKY